MGTTRHLEAKDPEQVLEAAQLLRTGKLVAFPTETVYGLGGNALSADAIRAIFHAKQRPAWDPLIVHLADAGFLNEVVQVPDGAKERVRKLAKAFWPGPLTLLLPRTQAVPDAVTAGRALVGVRVPAHGITQVLLRAAQVPVAAPSANLFGHVSPTTAEHVLADLDGRIDAVLDAGPCAIGLESTVLDPLQTPMVVYRQGAVTPEALRQATGGEVSLYVGEPQSTHKAEQRTALPAPGVGLRHYAPRARLVLVDGGADRVCARASELSADGLCGVLWPGDWRLPERSGALIVEPWGRWDDARSRAAALFAGLRALDNAGVRWIVCPLPESGGLEGAIRDRLEKAARQA